MMNISNFLLVGLGGALGAMARYGVQVAMTAQGCKSHWATMAVNLTGCFLIGLLLGSSLRQAEWRLLLVTGLCGGYTTFSTLAADALSLLQRGEWAAALGYLGGSLAGGIVAVWLAVVLARQVG